LYKNILIPLDGSELAEEALREALPMAKLYGVKVTTLKAVEPAAAMVGIGVPAMYLRDIFTSRKKSALAYLRSVAYRPQYRSLKFRVAVATGAPADQILQYADSHSIDLIIMSTHGRSGIGRWAFGSVADKVLRGAKCPILLVRAFSKGKR
jgi:nucleotide-binding universal stress UspA family protein